LAIEYLWKSLAQRRRLRRVSLGLFLRLKKSFLKKSDDDFPFISNFDLSKHLSVVVPWWLDYYILSKLKGRWYSDL